jgi:hypothetical protein
MSNTAGKTYDSQEYSRLDALLKEQQDEELSFEKL